MDSYTPNVAKVREAHVANTASIFVYTYLVKLLWSTKKVGTRDACNPRYRIHDMWL
jgi:hypothetical protein